MSTDHPHGNSQTDAPHISPELKKALLKAFPAGVVAIDLETTGLSPLIDKIIELSAVKITQDSTHHFDQLIQPGITIPSKTIEIHGITDEMVKDSPGIEEVLPEFYDFVGDLPLIAHNAKFDIGFLMFQSHQLNIKPSKNHVYCSCQYARVALPKQRSFRLKDLTENLSIELVNHHRALDDAMAALKVFAHGIQQRLMEDQKMILSSSRLFSLTEFSPEMELEIADHLKLLVENVKDQNHLMIKYQGGSHKGKMRPIRPISLLPMPAGNILYAHCLLSDLYKSFALNKIREVVEMTEEELEKYGQKDL